MEHILMKNSHIILNICATLKFHLMFYFYSNNKLKNIYFLFFCDLLVNSNMQMVDFNLFELG